MTLDEIYRIYTKILGYKWRNTQEIMEFGDRARKASIRERQHIRRIKAAKDLGLPLEVCFNKRRFDTYVRLFKKKEQLTAERKRSWDRPGDDDRAKK